MKTLGPYRLIEELARGGMGVVYRAHDPRVDREVGLKLLLGYEGEVDAEASERFAREGEALGRVRHGNVLQVHDFGWERGKPYLVTELVAGTSLKEHLRHGPLPEAQARGLVVKLAGAVAAAHAVGVLHRDLKPENVILRADDGEPVLIDFGLARLSGRQSLTASGTAVGTLRYCSPEQCAGDSYKVDGRADIYGLGVVLCVMITRRFPKCPESMQDLRGRFDREYRRIMTKQLVPEDVINICRKAMRYDAKKRYQTSKQMARDLKQALEHLSGSQLARSA